MDRKTRRASTEGANPLSKGLDLRPAIEIVTLMHDEDALMVEALKPALPMIARAAEDAADAIRSGGSVVYAGAGTSGRLAVLDASEIMPTFGSGAFRAFIAGGPAALTSAIEGAEDDREAGRALALDELRSSDMAVGVTASGRTPFVLGFMQGARQAGARCWMLICSDAPADIALDGLIAIDTGAEVISGSTRLKAGTATKMALNMLSTAAMVMLGGSYDGLMVDVIAANQKLVRRAEDIIMQISGAARNDASQALRDSGMRAKTASLMLMLGIGRQEAEGLLRESSGSLRGALREKG